jgi:hypothetical protein
MITTTWTTPSADLLGGGSAAVRTGAVAMAARVAAFQGAGVPFGTPAVGRRRGCPAATERFIAPTYLPQHDGTSLGIHSSGRPQS